MIEEFIALVKLRQGFEVKSNMKEIPRKWRVNDRQNLAIPKSVTSIYWFQSWKDSLLPVANFYKNFLEEKINVGATYEARMKDNVSCQVLIWEKRRQLIS